MKYLLEETMTYNIDGRLFRITLNHHGDEVEWMVQEKLDLATSWDIVDSFSCTNAYDARLAAQRALKTHLKEVR